MDLQVFPNVTKNNLTDCIVASMICRSLPSAIHSTE